MQYRAGARQVVELFSGMWRPSTCGRILRRHIFFLPFGNFCFGAQVDAAVCRHRRFFGYFGRFHFIFFAQRSGQNKSQRKNKQQLWNEKKQVEKKFRNKIGMKGKPLRLGWIISHSRHDPTLSLSLYFRSILTRLWGSLLISLVSLIATFSGRGRSHSRLNLFINQFYFCWFFIIFVFFPIK